MRTDDKDYSIELTIALSDCNSIDLIIKRITEALTQLDEKLNEEKEK